MANGKIQPNAEATKAAVKMLQEHFNSRIGIQIRGDQNTALVRCHDAIAAENQKKRDERETVYFT